MKDAKKKTSFSQMFQAAIRENPEIFERKIDSNIELKLESFFQMKEGIPSTDELTTFVGNLIDEIAWDFEDSTERKDVRTRLNEFNLKIYTIKSNVRFSQIAPQELFTRVLKFLQTEEEPTGKQFNPIEDENRAMSEEELRKRDYNTRFKIFQDRINSYGVKMPLELSSDMQTIFEVFESQPGEVVSIDFGRMNTREAAYITRILFGLGYRANFYDVKAGNVCAQKIPLVMYKRKEEKSGQQFGKESIGVYDDPCFPQDVYKKLIDYERSLDDLEANKRELLLRQIKAEQQKGKMLDEQISNIKANMSRGV